MYLEDDDALYTDITDIDEKLIFDCIFTRNCNGFLREKHLKNIIACDAIPEWCMPYILRLSSEYVVDINYPASQKASIKTVGAFLLPKIQTIECVRVYTDGTLEIIVGGGVTFKEQVPIISRKNNGFKKSSQ